MTNGKVTKNTAAGIEDKGKAVADDELFVDQHQQSPSSSTHVVLDGSEMDIDEVLTRNHDPTGLYGEGMVRSLAPFHMSLPHSL